MMTHFRQRLNADIINQLNEEIVMEELNVQNQDDQADDKDDNDEPPAGSGSPRDTREQANSEQSENKGKLLLDASCTPADIAYSTDLGLLSEAREKLEHIIDVLHAPHRGIKKKLRT